MNAWLSHAALAAAGLAVGHWALPGPVQVVTHNTVRTVTVRDVVRNRERVTTKPDGTVITDRTNTVITDRSTGSTEASSVTTPKEPPRWAVGALTGLTLAGAPVYGGYASYRVLGPFSATAWGMGGGVTAAGVGLGFVW